MPTLIPIIELNTTGCSLKIVDTSAVSAQYLDTLLRYYEEEIQGEAYFFALARHFDEQDKMILLGKVERVAAAAIEPLLQKYDLQPRSDSAIHDEWQGNLWGHEALTWPEFITHILDRYPAYLDDFHGLENMAPAEDLPALKVLTNHEVAVLDFAEKERGGDPDSLKPLIEYMG